MRAKRRGLPLTRDIDELRALQHFRVHPVLYFGRRRQVVVFHDHALVLLQVRVHLLLAEPVLLRESTYGLSLDILYSDVRHSARELDLLLLVQHELLVYPQLVPNPL